MTMEPKFEDEEAQLWWETFSGVAEDVFRRHADSIPEDMITALIAGILEGENWLCNEWRAGRIVKTPDQIWILKFAHRCRFELTVLRDKYINQDNEIDPEMFIGNDALTPIEQATYYRAWVGALLVNAKMRDDEDAIEVLEIDLASIDQVIADQRAEMGIGRQSTSP